MTRLSAELGRRIASLAACLAALAGPAAAEEFALECDVVAGIRSVRVSAPAGVGLRSYALDARTWVVEVGSPRLPGLSAGGHPCVAATALRVLPGELLGSATSRILVRHSGELPRSVEAPGRLRLTWLPEVSPTRERRVVAESPPPEAEEAARRERAREEARREEEDRRRAEAEREAREREEDGRRAQAEREAREREEDERRAAAEREAREREDERRRAAERDEARRRAEALAEAEREPEPERRRVVVDRPSEPVRAPASLPPDYAALSSPARLVVTIPTVVKDGPGRRYRTLKRLAAGDRATVQGRAGDWYLLGDGSSWVFATFLEAADSASSSAPSYLGVVQDVTVPVHEGPGGQHAVVAELYRGQQVVIDELNGEWAHVRNGGWVRRSALGPLEPGREGR